LLPYAPMLLTDYDFDLPDRLIARHPAPERRGSRLLEVGAELADRRFADLPKLLRAGDLLVFNDTRVIPARLGAVKATGGRAEILIERVLDTDRAIAHLRASKSPKPGTDLLLDNGVSARVRRRENDLYEIRFSVPVADVLAVQGQVPLPPYLEREATRTDKDRYQTVYAKNPGAVAAPTAGLHFDEQMLEETRAMGVVHAWVTLHVGAGTFQSLRREHIEENRLHRERVQVSQQVCDQVRDTRAGGGRVICVGTTAVRALESAAGGGELEPLDGETELFIQPGYRFRAVDAMLTNFHLPKSSLLLLVSAFAGRERVLDAYRHAIASDYRFFSYGDCMFLAPAS
jgi:S-adenosylmethionine:tRNA ribosyltransferase-isomerase